MDAQDIVDDALRTRDALAKLESAINSEIDAIGFQAFREKRDLTADERSRRDHLRASRGEVQDAFAELAFVTLAKLNRSADVQNLLHDIAEANKGLEGDLERLKTIEKIADTVKDVAAQLPKVVAGLAQILPFLAV